MLFLHRIPPFHSTLIALVRICRSNLHWNVAGLTRLCWDQRDSHYGLTRVGRFIYHVGTVLQCSTSEQRSHPTYKSCHLSCLNHLSANSHEPTRSTPDCRIYARSHIHRSIHARGRPLRSSLQDRAEQERNALLRARFVLIAMVQRGRTIGETRSGDRDIDAGGDDAGRRTSACIHCPRRQSSVVRRRDPW